MSEMPPRFSRYISKAESLVTKPGRVQSLIAQSARKLTQTSGQKMAQMRGQLGTTIALLRAWLSGDYRQVSNKTLVILIAGLLYFVMPLDVIPDFIFGWGLIDDAAVLSYVFNQVMDETKAFEHWQSQQKGSESDAQG